jgi:hypothetical protein
MVSRPRNRYHWAPSGQVLGAVFFRRPSIPSTNLLRVTVNELRHYQAQPFFDSLGG